VLLFAVAILGLAFALRRRRPALGMTAGALALGGLIALGGVLALDGFTWGILGDVWSKPEVDKASIELALKDVQESQWNLYFYLGALVWIVGMIALTVGLIRSHVIPLAAGLVFALGAALVGVEAAVANNAYFIFAAVVLALGGLLVGVSLMRMSDAAFAADHA
jgi:hypothetical protein